MPASDMHTPDRCPAGTPTHGTKAEMGDAHMGSDIPSTQTPTAACGAHMTASMIAKQWTDPMTLNR